MGLMILVVISLISTSEASQSFSAEPSDVTVAAGGDLRLECRVSDQRGQCQWTRDGFGLGINPSLPGFPRYTMSEVSDECDLLISPVLPTDQAGYQCQVGAAAGHPPVVSRRAEVRVTAQPGSPYIVQASERDVLEVLEGSHLVLDCVSQGGRPPAQIHWYRDNSLLRSANIQENIMKEEDGSTFRTHSTITFIPKQNMKMKCSSSSDQFPQTKFSHELEIRLRYPPKLNININTDKISEGDKFSVTCESRAYPENVAYKWFFNDQELEGEEGATLDIEGITRSDHESRVRCSVANEIGRSEVATDLSVVFAPRIIKHPSSVTARRGDNVTFHCLAESNPAPTYLWTRHQHDTLEAVTQNLTVVASEFTEKTYVCKVYADGHQVISSLPAKLMLLRKPIIYTEMFRSAKEGETLVLTCLVDSVSNHTNMMWTKNDDPLEIVTGKHRVVKTHQGREYSSDLIINKMSSSDFGNYGCFAINEVGKDYARIRVLNKSDTSILGVGVGIAVAVGVIFILLGVVVYKIRQKCCHYDRVATEDNGKMSMKIMF